MEPTINPIVVEEQPGNKHHAVILIAVFVFAVLHVAASHYAYGNTPWGEWVSAQFGWERNHYDRIVHFLFGALILPVAGELFKNQLPKRRFAAGVFLFSFIFALGSLYEVAEFAAGVIVDPEAGLGFLGFQGDIWDTQKDMALQALGATMGLRFWRLRLRGPSASVK